MPERGRGRLLVAMTLLLVLGAVSVIGARTFRHHNQLRKQAHECTDSQQRRQQAAALRASQPPYVLVVGDSYAEGVGLTDPRQAFPYQLQQPVVVLAEAGAGYAVSGVCGDGQYEQRLAGETAGLTPTATVIEGSVNDSRASAADLGVAVRSTLAQTKGRVLLLGPPLPPSEDAVKLERVDATLRRVAADQGVQYVPALHVLNPTDFGSDGLHPNATGQRKLAALVAPFLR